jgi:predicted porin
MNKNIKLAVAGAVLALGATAANAGIIIPAGDWTLDIGGNVNTYYTSTRATGDTGIIGGRGGANATGTKTANNITTGLLPAFLSVSGTTRQNDLDVSFTVSIQPGTADGVGGTLGSQNNRQAFLTFGDKSWGSFKLGKDLGIFASDAILSDMTLLGVGNGAGNFSVIGSGANNTTLGRIGTGYMYADWKSQIAYTTPNFNGFQATVGVTQAWNAHTSGDAADPTYATTASSITETLSPSGFGGSARGGSQSAYEGKASYSFAANDVTGKVWVSGFAQKVVGTSDNAYAGDIGANVNAGGFGLTGYYYSGKGVGQTIMLRDGYDNNGARRESDGGYVQATYVLPTKTKLGVSWGESNLDLNAGDSITALVKKNEQWTAGLYHPVTKHLNLVAEYSDVESESHSALKAKAKTASLGAILFF